MSYTLSCRSKNNPSLCVVMNNRLMLLADSSQIYFPGERNRNLQYVECYVDILGLEQKMRTKVKCSICGIMLNEGKQYQGHMIIQHDFPTSWSSKSSDSQAAILAEPSKLSSIKNTRI